MAGFAGAIIGSDEWTRGLRWGHGGRALAAVLMLHPPFGSWSIASWAPAAAPTFLGLAERWVDAFGDLPGSLEALVTYLTLAGDHLDPNRGLSLLSRVLARVPRRALSGVAHAAAWLRGRADRADLNEPEYRRVVDRLAETGDSHAIAMQRDIERTD